MLLLLFTIVLEKILAQNLKRISVHRFFFILILLKEGKEG